MAKFEKHITLSFGTGVGIGTVSTTSASYGETTNPAYISFDTSKYAGATIYFEAVLKTSAATGYAALYDTAGNVVSGSEVTTTSTSATRVRSSAITPATGTYTVRIKNDGVNTTTYYSARIIIVQSASAITATETQIPLVGGADATSSAGYADTSTTDQGQFLYTSANWNGTVQVFFEATFKTSAGTGTVGLHDTSNNLVSGSEITTTSASFGRVRSSAISLSDATLYKPRIKTSAGTLTISDARIVIQQTNSPTKTESYIPLLSTTTSFSAVGSYSDTLQKINYDSTNWSTDTASWFHDFTTNANTASGQQDLFGLTSAAEVTGSAQSTLNNAVLTHYRSGSVTLPVSQEITEKINSAAGTLYCAVAHLVGVLTWKNQFSSSFIYLL